MRKFALVAVKFAVSAALLYFAVGRVNLDMLGDRLNNLDAMWIVAAVAVTVLQVVLVAIRWQRIVRICGAALPLWAAVRFNMVATFFSQVLPSTVGGDAARIWLLARTGAGWVTATYSVLLDRFVGVLMLAILVAGGLYWSFGLIGNHVGRVVLLVIGLGSLAGAAAFLALGSWPALKRWKITRPFPELALLGRKVLFSRQSGPTAVSISLVVHLTTALVAWMVSRAVAVQLGYADAVLLVLPVMLIATVPVSIAGWGVRESALVLAFTYAGLPAADGLVVSVLLGATQFVVGIIGGIVWLISPGRRSIPADMSPEQAPPTG